MQDLKGQAAIVTGASRGIGAAASRELARQGVAVLLFARSGAEMEATVVEIQAAGGRAAAFVGDVTRYAEVQAAVEDCRARFGRLDILVNNAGVIDPIARLADSDPEGWDLAVDINLKGVYHGLRAALPVMAAQGHGVIVNLSSGAATGAVEGWSHYCATKAAVLSLTRVAQKEYGEQGVRVHGLSPGTVATDMQRAIKASGINPVSKLNWEDHIDPDWPARAIAYLCSAEAADLAGEDFSIKTEAGRARVGLG
ncbi:MAG: SDR family oxidoreductase [Rhodospirillales bacterium]